MKDIDLVKLYIAGIAAKGATIQDIFNDLQNEDWDIWIEEAREREENLAKIIVCGSCCHNFEAREGDYSHISSCPKCKEEYANRLISCEHCKKVLPQKDAIWSGIDKLRGKYCSEECIDLAKEQHKIPCLACGTKFLPFAEKVQQGSVPSTLCEKCWTPEMRKERDRVGAHNNRAIQAGLEATLTLSQWLRTLEYFERKCAYCHKTFKHLEHVMPLELGGGTTINNCVPSCGRCNAKKHDTHPDDLDRKFPAANLQRIREYLASITVAQPV